MNILIVCMHGKNRSVYLQHYLKQIGYDALTAGVKNDGDDLEKKIHEADTIISVHPRVEEMIQERFDLSGKRFIKLNVDDRPEHILPDGKELSGLAWETFQHEYVYPKLIEQLNRYLPF